VPTPISSRAKVPQLDEFARGSEVALRRDFWHFTVSPQRRGHVQRGRRYAVVVPADDLLRAKGKPALDARGPAAAGQVDAAPLEFPLATEAQRAGELDERGTPWDRGAPVDVHDTQSDPLDDVIRRRSSQRRMDAERALPEDVLRDALAVALRGIALPHRVIVHNVDGVAPGVYRWPGLDAPIRPGDLRHETFVVALKQGLAQDAAFVVIGAADVASLDDREYREANLAAGLVEGRLHLAAYALGASASGMTFVDSEVPTLLGEQLEALLFTCVSVPE
jgi:hypothetical protein